jgi:hypothetical protein
VQKDAYLTAAALEIQKIKVIVIRIFIFALAAMRITRYFGLEK